MKAILCMCVIMLALGTNAVPAIAEPPPARAEHVVIIGLDGARPEAFQRKAGPVLRELIAQGSVAWHARATMPTVTQVNWASMLTGCTPRKHGIDVHPITEPELSQRRLRVPTLFTLVAESGGTASGFLGHWKLYPLESGETGTQFVRSPYEAARVAPLAAQHLRVARPTVCFIWMGDLDGRGHKHGWLSDEQLAAMALIDDAIGEIVGTLREVGMWERTLLIISSDHGGHGRGHGQGTEEDAIIPWLAVGPGIRRGHTINGAVSICDTTATALHALGLPLPAELDGRPVFDAFVTDPAVE